MEKKLRGVCVGLGYFSQFHLEAWKRIDGVEIVAICDQDLEKAKDVAKNYDIPKIHSNVEEIFSEVSPDFVDIITPPDTHTELCILAGRYGIDIICQKPLAPTLEEAGNIAKAAKESGVRMMVHENFRFQPWHREIKMLLGNEVIGKVHAINLRTRMGDGWQENAYMDRQPYFRKMERLLMYETGIHFIDVFRYYLGDVDNVYGKLKRLNKNIEGEDFAWVQFIFANGALGLIDANRYNESTCKNPRLTFGALLVEGCKGSIRLYEDGKITVQPLGKKEEEHQYTYRDINFSGDCVFYTQRHFIEQIMNGESFETDVSEYLKNIAVLEKVYESDEKGIPLSVNY